MTYFEAYTGLPITLTDAARSVYDLWPLIEDDCAMHLYSTLEDGNLEDRHVGEALADCRRLGETLFMRALLGLREAERHTVWGRNWGLIGPNGEDVWSMKAGDA